MITIPKISNWKIIHILLPYIWGGNLAIKIRILIGLFLVVATMILNLSVPLILRNTIQVLNEFELKTIIINYHWIAFLLLAYGGFYTLGQITLKARQIIFYKVIERAIQVFSLKIFNHLHSLGLQFHLQKKTGVITNSVEKFQYALPNIFWTLVLFIIPTLTEIILAIAILFYLYHWSYSLTLLGILIAFSIFSFIGSSWIKITQTNYDDSMLEVHGRMVDSLLNYETVQYFNNKVYETTVFNNLLENSKQAAIRFHIKSDLIQMIQGTIVGIGLCVLTWRSGHEVLAGALHMGDFIVINSYLLQFVAPMVNFGWTITLMNQAFTKLRYVMQLLEEKSEIIDSPNATPLYTSSADEIIFEEVHFHYHPKRPLIQGISFQVPAGKTLAIVGTTGAGKSTIARLLFRFYDVVHGRILINNQDVRTVFQASLRAVIGVVPQDTILFNTTIYENILYGNPSATQKEVDTVVKLAHLDRFISCLPEGYDTIVGERGLKLSGGEKQRVSIARAILKKPSIFLFDEATSSLDTATEQEIKKNILEISQGTTTIIIAHRLSTITHADEIIVLDKGKIVERGKHEKLLKKNAVYARLWNIQVPESINLDEKNSYLNTQPV